MHGFTRRTLIPFLLFVLFVMLFPGCSSGGNNDSPVLTSTTPSPNDITEGNVPAGNSHHACLLYCLINFDITDPNDPKFEVVPFRLSTMHLNVLKFMETAPCTDCISIENLQLTQPGVLDADIRLRNPFEDKYFTVFDVRGIIMFDGSHVFPESGLTVSDPAMGDFGLLNADGYTALYNGSTMGMAVPLLTYYPGEHSSATVPNSDLNGYRRYNADWIRHKFPIGVSSIRPYTIKFNDSSKFVAGYAVDASWSEPINNPVIDPETDFGPEANCCEAWKIEVFDTGHGLTDTGGSTDLLIRVFDWQYSDDTHPVVVECPELFDGEVQATLESPGDHLSQYYVTIENTKLAEEGYYRLLVRKEASENDLVSKPWLDLTAYQVVQIQVEENIGQLVEVTPPWLNMNPDLVCVKGDRAYLASGIHGLYIFDISDPENPLFVKWVHVPAEITSFAVTEGHAYVAADKLFIIDLDPIESACIVKTVAQADPVRYVTINGDLLYASCYDEFKILDISVSQFPMLLYTYEIKNTIGSCTFGKLTVTDEYAYVGVSCGCGDIGGGSDTTYLFGIYDINPPESTHFVGSVQTVVSCRDIAVTEGYAYAINIYAINNDLTIIDIDPPETPDLVGSTQLPHNTNSLEVSGDYLYVTYSEAGLEIFNIQQPDSPYLVNTINTPGSAMDVALSGDTALIADAGSGLQIIDIEEIASSGIIGSFVTLADAYAVGVSGDYAYVGGRNFQIVDIEQPENAHIVNTLDGIYGIVNVAVEGGYAYINGQQFQIIDIDPPESAHLVHAVDVLPYRFVIADGYAYSVRDDLNIIDIDPPESAHIISTVDMPWISNGVAVSGGYAYVTACDSKDSDNGEIKIIDIDPIESAHIVQSLTTIAVKTYGIAVAGDYAYVATDASESKQGVKIINIEDPESPFIFNTTRSCSNPYGIEALGGHICTINGEDGIEVIDIDPPQSPYKVTEIESHGFSYDIVVSGGYMYVADLSGGLRIFQFQ